MRRFIELSLCLPWSASSPGAITVAGSGCGSERSCDRLSITKSPRPVAVHRIVVLFCLLCACPPAAWSQSYLYFNNISTNTFAPVSVNVINNGNTINVYNGSVSPSSQSVFVQALGFANLEWDVYADSGGVLTKIATFTGTAPAFQTFTYNLNGRDLATNCVYSGTIHNPANYPLNYYVATSSGSYFLVNVISGGNQTFTWTDPNCGGGAFTYAALINGNLNTAGQPAGTANGQGSVTPVNPASGPLQLGDIMNGNGALNGSPTNQGGFLTDLQPYQAPALTNANTNGPINFGTNAANNPTNAANNGTIQQAANAQYAAIIQGDQALLNELQHFHTDNNAGMSNANTSLTGIKSNTFATASGVSNLISLMTNSGYGDGSTNVASANAASSAGTALLQTTGDSLGTIAAPALRSGSWPVTIGSGAFATTVELNPLNGAAMFPAVALAAPWVRTLSSWALTFWFLLWLVAEINEVVRLASLAPQTNQGGDIPVVGELTSRVAAGVCIAAVTVLLTATIAYVTSAYIATFLAHPFGGSGTVIVQNGIALLDAVFNIGLCLTLAAQRLAVPFYLTKAYFICVSVIRFATG